MPKSAKLGLLAVSVVVVLGLFVGANFHGVSAASDAPQEGAYRQINVYSEVLQHIQNDYVEEPNMGKVTHGALRGLLESLDPDSSYLSPADYKTWKDAKAGKAQVGIVPSKRFGYATVVSVVPGSPADKANITDGDIIEAIDGKDTRDIPLAMIQLMMAGAPGSELKLAVLRPRSAKPDALKLNRVVVVEPAPTDTWYENNSILYLKPETLDKDHVSYIESKLKGASKQPGKKVLLDLRDVASGEMSEGVRLANFFLASGTIATLEGQKFEKQTFSAEGSKTINAKSPVVVLVNHGTAGAAEIVAAALADNKRADVVGSRTFGQGTQAKTFEMPDGGALILSIAKYVSPDGKKFEDDGVTPATLVENTTPDDDDAADDSAPKPATPVNSTKKKPKMVDDQLTKALEMLKAKTA
ncbi:S41 family peptidase [Granulicella cerasi]|uniref:S41 family peptidase n=1 Tax=Granulicella cerasi TaxID=741063 RepID=A0ABW1Z8M1_9BACT|nr:S41 family peptidase [Granulicella cerasi]